MELYFSPGACSMASHIALNEAGIEHKMHKVDLKNHTYENGKDYYELNPKGYVPALKLDNGEILTENAVVLQYIADQKPEMKLMPAAGTMERYRAMEWLNFVATELHKGFGPFFNPDATDEQKSQAKKKLTKKFAIPAKALEKNEFLNGNKITAPDMYLYVMLTWAQKNSLDLSSMPSLMKFHEKMESRPSVRETAKMEGLDGQS
jgi:glutathione S-transferase